jgi:hypothetical protein
VLGRRRFPTAVFRSRPQTYEHSRLLRFGVRFAENTRFRRNSQLEDSKVKIREFAFRGEHTILKRRIVGVTITASGQ